MPGLGRSDNVGESMPQPFRAGLTFWRSALRASKPRPQSPERSSKRHFQDGPAKLQIPIRLRSGQALGCAPTARRGRRDDKFKGGGAPWHGWRWMDKVEFSRRHFSPHSCAVRSSKFSATPSSRGGALLPVRPDEPDDGRQQHNLYAEVKAVENLLEAWIGFP